ncbi:hypothetical protein O181_109078 [Austropuccinia psidii MF-1]|uniref:Uncharacterized protein n=1 Tax=Austropuccinia psidii MF-1 TaxID=1389203 RepID=A0A9Q3JU20_9BASI|nr:hypothetical protein [Austropuccinia psidii MF-1]
MQVINPKDKNVSPEERQKWRMPELPQVPKDLNNFQHAAVGIYQSQYKNWFTAEKKQEWKILPTFVNSNNELLPSSQEVFGPIIDTRTYEGVENYFFQGTGPKDNIVSENPKHFFKESAEMVVPKEGQQPCGSSPSLQKCQKKERKTQITIMRASSTLIDTEVQRRKKQPWKMNSIWKEL